MNLPPHICPTCLGDGEVWLHKPGWDDPGDSEPCPDCEATGYRDLHMWIAVYNSHTSATAPDTARQLAQEVAQ